MGGIGQIVARYQVSADPLRSERKVELIALLLAVVLIIQLAYNVAVLTTGSRPRSILPSPDSLQIAGVVRTGLVTAQQSNEVRARPVFWPSRTPVPEQASEVVASKHEVAKKNQLSSVKLLGVIGSGNSAVVIVLVNGQKKRILLGDKVVGWTLESVAGGEAVFSEKGKTQGLVLKQAAVAAPIKAQKTAVAGQAKPSKGSK